MTRQSSRELASTGPATRTQDAMVQEYGSAESLCQVELVNVAQKRQPFRTWQIVQCALGHDPAGPRERLETSTKMARRAISSILARVGDKWTVLIVVLLGDGPKRFNEISGGYGMKALLIVLLAFASAAAEAGSLEGL
jgi:hypothetical protein